MKSPRLSRTHHNFLGRHLHPAEILDKEVVGKLGEGHSDTLRQIIMNWLSEQGYLAKGGKHEEKQS